jgi:hypothetical protein
MKQFIASMPNSPAFRDYVQSILADGGYTGDIRTDANTMRIAITAVGDYIAAQDATMWAGYTIQAITWNEVTPQRTPAQTLVLRGLIDNLIATID